MILKFSDIFIVLKHAWNRIYTDLAGQGLNRIYTDLAGQGLNRIYTGIAGQGLGVNSHF